MYTLEYLIVERTPCGCRGGEITINIEEWEISGRLSLPFFSPQYYGKVDGMEILEIRGTLVFYDGEYEYFGKGKISPYAISIQTNAQIKSLKSAEHQKGKKQLMRLYLKIYKRGLAFTAKPLLLKYSPYTYTRQSSAFRVSE